MSLHKAEFRCGTPGMIVRSANMKGWPRRAGVGRDGRWCCLFRVTVGLARGQLRLARESGDRDSGSDSRAAHSDRHSEQSCWASCGTANGEGKQAIAGCEQWARAANAESLEITFGDRKSESALRVDHGPIYRLFGPAAFGKRARQLPATPRVIDGAQVPLLGALRLGDEVS